MKIPDSFLDASIILFLSICFAMGIIAVISVVSRIVELSIRALSWCYLTIKRKIKNL